MIQDATQRTAVLVLGMHRSGTSAVTRFISLLGADLPRNLMLPLAGNNEVGFWESMDAYRLNDRVLEAAGSRWDDWRPLAGGWLQLPAVEQAKADALDLLARDFDASRLFVLKDPRMCRLAPFWVDALRAFGARVGCVLALRNPLAVAASLARRDGFPAAKSQLLWLRHTLDAERNSRDLPRVLLPYDALLQDWRRWVHPLARALGVTWPDDSAQAAEIDRFLAPHLRHHNYGDEALARDPTIDAWVAQAYAALQSLGSARRNSAARTALDAVRAEFDRASLTLGAAAWAETQARQAAEAAAEAEAARRDERIRALEQQVRERDRQTAALSEVIEERDRSIRLLEALLAERAARVEAQQALDTERAARVQALELAITDRDSQVQALQSAADAQRKRVDVLEQSLAAYQTQRRQLARRLLEQQARRGWLPRALAARLGLRAEPRLLPPWHAFGLRQGPRAWLALLRLGRAVARSGLFDARWYVEQYPDVLINGADPFWHWMLVGWREGRHPNALFDTAWYLQRNPDVAASGINPLFHYLRCGAGENRAPGPLFDTAAYVADHPALAGSGENPLAHYLARVSGDGPAPPYRRGARSLHE